MKRVLMAALVLGALASPSAADRADDDLAAVKKAVGTTVEAEAKPPAEEPARRRARRTTRAERTTASGRRPARARASRSGSACASPRRGRSTRASPSTCRSSCVRALGEDLEIESTTTTGTTRSARSCARSTRASTSSTSTTTTPPSASGWSSRVFAGGTSLRSREDARARSARKCLTCRTQRWNTVCSSLEPEDVSAAVHGPRRTFPGGSV